MVPELIPVTTPELLIVPMLLLSLIQKPPEVELDNVIVFPIHTLVGPAIVCNVGESKTVIAKVAVAEQPPPLVTVYFIVSTPADNPATNPVLVTTETFGSTLVHVPPEVASAKLIVLPTQTVLVPVIGAILNVLDTVKGKDTVVAQVPLLKI
jgi:hypothetical protein